MKVREEILSIKPYVPGKPIAEVKRELGLDDVIKLASNENPRPIACWREGSLQRCSRAESVS